MKNQNNNETQLNDLKKFGNFESLQLSNDEMKAIKGGGDNFIKDLGADSLDTVEL